MSQVLDEAVDCAMGLPMARDRKCWCRVIGIFHRDVIDVLLHGRVPSQIPTRYVPPDLRIPNKEFWLAWEDGVFFVYRNENDSEPTSADD